MLWRYTLPCRRVIALLGACAVVACGETEPPAVFGGEYVLQSVAGRELPVTIFRDSAVEVLVTKGSVTFGTDSTFVDARSYRVTAAGAAPAAQYDTIRGTWSLDGERVLLHPVNAEPYEMVWWGTSLAWYVEGFIYRYWK